MKFKVTRLKISISILIGFFGALFLSMYAQDCAGGLFCGIYWNLDLIKPVLFGIIPGILCYLIWSLMQE